jgi:ATP-dependent RNA helicase RhlE
MDRVLVFTRTKRGADRVARHVGASGVTVAAIHGDKPQHAREKALDRFRRGAVRVLVATDIAARGLDVPGVTHVVNFDVPHVPEDYVHRIGRTARAGRTGAALTFCDGGERASWRDNRPPLRAPAPPARRVGTSRERAHVGRAPGAQRGARPRGLGAFRPSSAEVSPGLRRLLRRESEKARASGFHLRYHGPLKCPSTTTSTSV